MSKPRTGNPAIQPPIPSTPRQRPSQPPVAHDGPASRLRSRVKGLGLNLLRSEVEETPIKPSRIRSSASSMVPSRAISTRTTTLDPSNFEDSPPASQFSARVTKERSIPDPLSKETRPSIETAPTPPSTARVTRSRLTEPTTSSSAKITPKLSLKSKGTPALSWTPSSGPPGTNSVGGRDERASTVEDTAEMMTITRRTFAGWVADEGVHQLGAECPDQIFDLEIPEAKEDGAEGEEAGASCASKEDSRSSNPGRRENLPHSILAPNSSRVNPLGDDEASQTGLSISSTSTPTVGPRLNLNVIADDVFGPHRDGDGLGSVVAKISGSDKALEEPLRKGVVVLNDTKQPREQEENGTDEASGKDSVFTREAQAREALARKALSASMNTGWTASTIGNALLSEMSEGIDKRGVEAEITTKATENAEMMDELEDDKTKGVEPVNLEKMEPRGCPIHFTDAEATNSPMLPSNDNDVKEMAESLAVLIAELQRLRSSPKPEIRDQSQSTVQPHSRTISTFRLVAHTAGYIILLLCFAHKHLPDLVFIALLWKLVGWLRLMANLF